MSNAHTNEISAGLRTAQVLGLTSTAFFTGKTFSQSYSTVPAFLLAPAPLLARQWKTMFDSDKLLSPVIVLFSGGVFAYFASREPHPCTRTAILNITSATLLALTIPYTYLIGEPINQKLEAKAVSLAGDVGVTEANVKREETVHYLVDRWAVMNLGRTVLGGLAAVLGTWAAVGAV